MKCVTLVVEYRVQLRSPLEVVDVLNLEGVDISLHFWYWTGRDATSCWRISEITSDLDHARDPLYKSGSGINDCKTYR